MANYQAVIFDQDETIFEKEVHYECLFAMMAMRYGKDFDPRGELRRRALAKGWKEVVVPDMIKTLGLPIDVDEYDKWAKAYMTTAPPTDLMPGAERLIRHLKSHSVPIAIATSCDLARVEPTWRKAPELLAEFDVVVAGDDEYVYKGKPAPDLLVVAANRLGMPYTSCIYVGDNTADGEAAKAAKMRYVDVPNYLREDGDFEGATATITTLNDFPLEKLGLPTWPTGY